MTSNKTIKHYPLSSPQKDIWFDQILHPDVPLYNIGGYVRIDGSINPTLFEKAINQVIQENDALRIIIHEGESLPTQTFAENVHLKLDFYDFSEQEKAQKEALKLLRSELVKPFQLYDQLLFQFALCKTSANCYYWLKKYHHLIADGWAASLIVQRVAAAYNFLTTGKTSEQTNYAYPDFIQNDQAYLESEKFVKAKHYWQEKYREVPEPLLVPHHAAQFQGKTVPSQRATLRLQRPFYNQLIDFAKENNVSTFHVILGVLYCYFVRTCDREDFVIGLPTLNRSSAAFKQTAGMFVGVSPAWFRFGTDLNFVELMASIRKELQRDYRHQRFPISELNRKLGLQRENRQPLFDLTLSYMDQNYDANFEGSTVEMTFLPHNFEQNALAIFVDEFHKQGDIKVDFDYNLGFFDADEIDRLKARFEFLLGEILRQPSVPIRALQIMPNAELKKILVDWNDTATDYPCDKTIVDLFEEQVDKTPNAIAVVFENQQLTYEALNSKANQLAHYLQTLGVKPEVLVGICVERSIEMVIGLLGILKAGGAYLSLDPAYPVARLAFMLEDAQVPVLLTQSSLKEKHAETKAQLVCLDVEAETLSQYHSENIISGVGPENLAYVIYTSGSTGKPKGVLGIHKGMVNRLNWMWQTYPFEAEEVCCHRTSINFVDHVAELFSPLLKGVSLVLLTKEKMRDTVGIINILHQYRIVRLLLVPSLLRSLLEQGDNELQKLASVKYWFCSGEALPARLVKLFCERLPEGYLVNIYGSSEVSADVTAYQVERQDIVNILNYFSPEHKPSNYFISGHLPPESITTPFVTLDELKQAFKSKEIPFFPQEKEEYYGYLKDYVLPYLVNTSSPRFIGHMTSVLPSFNYDLIDLVSRLNQNMVKVETSKSLVFLERQAMAMLHHAFYYFPESFYTEYAQQSGNSLGITVSGGSMANISALWIARNLVLPPDKNFPGVAQAGLNAALAHYKYKNIVLLGSRLMHYSMKKAVSLLGLGMENIVYVDQDENGKMDIAALRRCIAECRQKKWCILALVGIAGATETGNIDPLEEMAEIAKSFNIYFHVDGAWGGPVVFSNRHKSQLKGIEKADSITLCGHKQLYLPQGISFCLFRQPDMVKAISISATYQAREGGYDFGQYSPEGSRSSLSLCLHAAFHLIGKQGYAKLIDNGIDKAQYLKEQLRKNEAFELMREPELNIVNFRYIPIKFRDKQALGLLTTEDNLQINEANIRLQEMQFQEGRSFFSRTQMSNTRHGKDFPIEVNRAVLANPLTTYQDIDFVLEDQLTIAAKSIENQYPVDKQEVYKLASSQPKRAEQEMLLDKYILPIGKPINNTQIYILDLYKKLVPVGVSGELHVGGAGLARGYLNRPELTAEKFISNPFSDDPNSRLYKTGDLARYRADGNIEYLGRIDNQVKIRGFRIEFGEIEAVLAQHPFVKENAVIVHEASETDKRLVAYFAPHQGQVIENKALRDFLTDRLPDYMVPSAFVTLKNLPLTPNGKIDRRALSQLSVSNYQLSEKTFVAPRTPDEELLANIWVSVLGVERVGVHDNFFELGGHSLLAVNLMARIGQQFGKKLPLSTLFQGPTIEKLATVLEQITDDEMWSSLVAIQPNGTKQPFFCIPGIGGNVTSFYQLAQQLGKEQPFYGLEAVGLDGKSKPYTKIEDMATHYIKEMQTMQSQGPYLLGGHSFGALVAFEMSQQLQKQGHEVAFLAIFDMMAPHLFKPKGVDWDEASFLFDAARVIERGLGKPLDVSYEVLQTLDSESQLNYLLERFKQASFLQPDADNAHIRGFINVYKANCRMNYSPPQDIKPTRITLFQTSELIEGTEWNETKREPTWGWSQYADGLLDVLMVPGDHFSMMNQPNVQVLAEKLKVCFE
jgi:putative pyridoxal-dependent aspartate 1-decarboxylase